jgi:hypothetical protein
MWNAFSSRRKVVQYLRLPESDSADVVSGHGTHVSGIVAGSNPSSASSGTIYCWLKSAYL